MDKKCKKFIKKIKQLNEGDSLSYYDYEILCITPKTTFILIHNMDLIEMDFGSLIDFIK